MENHHPYADGRMQLQNYHYYGGGAKPSSNPNGLPELRSYSVSHVSTAPAPAQIPAKWLKKGKSTNSSISKAWCFSDPELHRKTRVAGYKAYSLEGKMKGSFRKSFRWVKGRYSQLIHGW